jgi:hypothetical protein
VHAVPGLLAAGLHFADGTGLVHSRAKTFEPEALDLLRRSASDGFRVIRSQGFKANRARWNFENAIIECALWDRGASLALAVSSQSVDLDPDAAATAAEQFLIAESK